MLGATVPKAAIDEYGDAGRSENDVCLASHLSQGPTVDAVAKAKAM